MGSEIGADELRCTFTALAKQPHRISLVDLCMKEIRVLLVEDHFLAPRMALHSILSVHPQLRIIGEASDGAHYSPMWWCSICASRV